MRTRYSFWNIVVSIGAQFINIILLFFCRQIFLRYLSEEYLGVNGLFTNILTVFSLSELGIGTAMMYGMYKPVAENDEDKICRLMNLYKKLYFLVGSIVLILGLLLFPFLEYLIKENNIPHIKRIYLLYLADSVLSYFFSYKQTLIQAYQKAYIVSGISQAIRCIQNLMQIFLLIYFANYYMYLVVQISCQIGTNVVLALVADRMYPFLKNNKKDLPSKEEQIDLFRQVKATGIHKFGGVFVSNTDNLLISAFVGLSMVGIYSNYKMILNSLRLMMSYIYNAFTASIGNMAAVESKKKILEIYNSLNFMMAILYGWMSICLLLLFNLFIGNFFGDRFILAFPTVSIIVVEFYLHGMRQMTLRFRDGMGLYWYDRYKPIFEVIINLVFSVILVQRYQIAGVLLGTIISTLATNFWIEPYILMRYGIGENWEKNLLNYFVRYLYYAVFTLLSGIICWFSVNLIPDTGFISLIIKGFIISIVYLILTVLVFRKCREWNILWEKIMGILNMRLKNGE